MKVTLWKTKNRGKLRLSLRCSLENEKITTKECLQATQKIWGIDVEKQCSSAIGHSWQHTCTGTPPYKIAQEDSPVAGDQVLEFLSRLG